MATQTLERGTEVQPQVASHRRLDIQGLRGVAVTLVVAFHAGLPLPGGYIGVDVFFVISGFVITALLLRELEAADELNLRRFYARRARRLLPALALMLVIVALAGTLLLSPLGSQQQAAKTGTAAATFSANLSLYQRKLGGYFDPTQTTNAFLHTWSLAVEEQFYLFFPILLFGVWAWARRFSGRLRKTATAAAIAAGTVASLALSIALTSGRHIAGIQKPVAFAFYSAPSRAWEFGVGALLVFAAPRARDLSRRAAVALGVIGLIAIVAASRVFDPSTAFPGTAALVPVLGAALVILGGTVTAGGIGRLLSLRPIVWLGDISYGWYLWHWPLIVFAAAIWFRYPSWFLPLIAVASLIPTWLSYRFVERPIRFSPRFTGSRTIAVGLICILVPITAMATLSHVAKTQSSSTTVNQLRRQLRAHGVSVPGVRCRNTSLGQTCVSEPATGVRGSVWLVGDSQAGALIEPVAAATRRQGYGLHVAAYYGCPFVDELLIDHTANRADFVTGGPACQRFVHATVNAVTAAAPNLVIVASAVYTNGFELKDPLTHASASSERTQSRLYEAGLSRVLMRFKRAGVPSLVVNPIPQFPRWDPSICPAVTIFRDLTSCGDSRSKAAALEENAPVTIAEQQAATATGADQINFTDDLCSATTCATNRGKFFVYRDKDHLSVDGSLTLTDDLGRAIAHDADTRVSG
jgi:peptidoglycan/LPS O-acetylase OafA/YrhL